MLAKDVATTILEESKKNRTRKLKMGRQVAPISLNHLVEEGVRWHQSRQKRSAQFHFQFAPELYKTLGDPSQLRRLFSQLIDCTLEKNQRPQPSITIATGNLALSPIKAKSFSSREPLPLGWYALLRVQTDPEAHIPSIRVHRDAQLMQGLLTPEWKQLLEIIHACRAGVMTHTDAEERSVIDIVFPAMMQLR